MVIDYQTSAISVNAAAKKYGIKQRTLSSWAHRGIVKVLEYPKGHGYKMLVDEASVALARQAYTPYWRQGQERNLPLPGMMAELDPALVQLAAAGNGPQPELDTQDLIDRFAVFNKRLAKSTLEGYHFRLKDFAEHFPILPLDPEPIQEYIDSMTGSDAHRHTCATLLRTFYRWAYRLRHIAKIIEDPIELVKFPPDGRRSKLPRVLTDKEAAQVIEAARSSEEKILLRLLWTSGIRAGELRSLTGAMLVPADSGIPTPAICPDGKMGERKIWITQAMFEDLETLAAAKPGQFLFTNRKGEQLAKDGLYQRVRACMLKAGLTGKKLGPYSFRHTFITNVIADSGDIHLAQKLAGHSKIATTERYTHLAGKQVASGFDKFNPEHRLDNQELMSEAEARRLAAKIGVHYDGIQPELGYQFTDDKVTGTTFYGKKPREVEESLLAKRKLWNKENKERRELKPARASMQIRPAGE